MSLKNNRKLTKFSKGICNQEEIRLILIGKTGSGKSATGNSLLGKMAFKSENSLVSITRTTSYKTSFRFGGKLVVVDTPGLADTNFSDRDVLIEITKSYAMVSPGPHAFVMLIHPNRFTKEDAKILDTYKKLFGNEFEKYLVLVFTDKRKFQTTSDLDTFVNNIPEDHPIKNLIRSVKKRYMALDYSLNIEDQKEDAFTLLQKIEDMKGQNDPPYFHTPLTKYTEALYRHIEKILQNDKNYNENLRDEVRGVIFEMFTTYAPYIAAVAFTIGLTYGYGLPLAIKVLTYLQSINDWNLAFKSILELLYLL